MNAEIPTPDLAECERFAAMWCDLTAAPHITLTAIKPDGPTDTLTFARGTGEQLRDWIAREQGQGATCTSKSTKHRRPAGPNQRKRAWSRPSADTPTWTRWTKPSRSLKNNRVEAVPAERVATREPTGRHGRPPHDSESRNGLRRVIRAGRDKPAGPGK